MDSFLCRSCKVEKPLSEFRTYGRHKEKHYQQCKACAYEHYKVWKTENPEKAARSNPEWTFERRCKRRNVLPSIIKDTFKAQAGKCEICLDSINIDSCAIDHNHATNEFRGLLCRKCNTSIAFLKDSPSIADRAAKYLREKGYYGKD